MMACFNVSRVLKVILALLMGLPTFIGGLSGYLSPIVAFFMQHETIGVYLSEDYMVELDLIDSYFVLVEIVCLDGRRYQAKPADRLERIFDAETVFTSSMFGMENFDMMSIMYRKVSAKCNGRVFAGLRSDRDTLSSPSNAETLDQLVSHYHIQRFMRQADNHKPAYRVEYESLPDAYNRRLRIIMKRQLFDIFQSRVNVCTAIVKVAALDTHVPTFIQSFPVAFTELTNRNDFIAKWLTVYSLWNMVSSFGVDASASSIKYLPGRLSIHEHLVHSVTLGPQSIRCSISTSVRITVNYDPDMVRSNIKHLIISGLLNHSAAPPQDVFTIYNDLLGHLAESPAEPISYDTQSSGLRFRHSTTLLSDILVECPDGSETYIPSFHRLKRKRQLIDHIDLVAFCFFRRSP